ncbi:MAG: hypothetical protein KKD56_07140, partial [Acidobacteria bacterium]|nr:hypothetical protein [Acidobacteriota bacterium]MBU1473587.1 hypothetical protein [Acidobacteriota bacterium]
AICMSRFLSELMRISPAPPVGLGALPMNCPEKYNDTDKLCQQFKYRVTPDSAFNPIDPKAAL